MTPDRLRYLVNICKHRMGSETEHYARVARFLGVEPITLRRWMSGERPVPTVVEKLMEVLHFWPEVTAEAVDKLIQARDEKTMT
jgi:hypothetical protein